MHDDSNSELEELKIDRQRRAMLPSAGDGGATVVQAAQDKRVTLFINWLLAGVGTAVVWTIWHFGSEFSQEIGKLREELVKTNTQLSISIAQNARLEEDVKDHETRLRTLEGRNLRGEALIEDGVLGRESTGGRRGH